MPPRPSGSPVSPIFLLMLLITVGGGVLSAGHSPVMVTTGVVLLVLGGWAVSLCLHEFGHAAVAYRGGDTAVAQRGYLTLDIRRYADPGLSFLLPVIFLLLGGIPLPGGAVWINNWAIRSKATRSMVSLAGPLINLILGIILIAAEGAVALPYGPMVGLAYLALVQVIAFLLNILPVPGLDGFGVLEPYLSEQSRELAARVRPWAPLALFVILLAVPQVSRPFFYLAALLFDTLGGDYAAAAQGQGEFLFWQN